MIKEAMIKITEPEVVSKTELIENGATGVIIYNYDKSHVYYKGIDLGSFEELLNVKKYITDLQKKAEQGEHYKHLYSEVKKQKDDIVEYCKKAIESLNWKKRDIMQILTPENGYLKADIEIEINKYKDLLRMLGEIDE